MLRDLVLSFDCDEGHNEQIFMHAKQLLTSMMGLHVAQLFSKYIDSSNGYFYLPKGSGEECWKELCEESKKPDPNE